MIQYQKWWYNHAGKWDNFYITYDLKIQSFQSQRENSAILYRATNLYSVYIYRAIMTYLVKNDSENSEYSTKANATDFLMWIQPLPKVNYSEFTLILLSFIDGGKYYLITAKRWILSIFLSPRIARIL